MNPIAKFIKENRKAAGLTQEERTIVVLSSVQGWDCVSCGNSSRARKQCEWTR